MQFNAEWTLLPEPVFLAVVRCLSLRDILNLSECCHIWYSYVQDDYLWKKVFRRDFKVDQNVALRPGAKSWRSEYRRLTENIPMVKTEELHDHVHQVLHVSFSHNGAMFATCSKDGLVIVWDSGHPVRKKYDFNMKSFNWKYTQYSQFNQSDTLLLVSGVHFGSPQSSSGEIAVFHIGENSFELQCRVSNRPYDIFGTWFSDQFLLSGDIHWLAHLVSGSVIWLNKANQETSSEHLQILKQLYRFYNRNGSSIRAVMIANCPWLAEQPDLGCDQATLTTAACSSDDSYACIGNPISNLNSYDNQFVEDAAIAGVMPASPPVHPQNKSDQCIKYTEKFRREFANDTGGDQMDEPSSVPNSEEDEELVDDEEEEDDGDGFAELQKFDPKYLIFSLGCKTYTPHQIGFKQIRSVNFRRKMNVGISLQERIVRQQMEALEEPRMQPDWLDYDSVQENFDRVDKLIDLHGHVIGMGLSPDHRYLYVNSRPWPQGYVITNPMEPPPIAQEIDIHVIDLMTLQPVGTMLRAHKAYTPNTECFFIFLDVCHNYVASGAEDRHAYLWDRYYGVCLAKYQHTEVVNSVAFNPKDNEMFVTTSDDYTIKVWRSLAKAKSLGIIDNHGVRMEGNRETVHETAHIFRK